MYTYKLTLAYDGTNYSGWQIQSNGSSIQQHIQDALKILLHKDVVVIGSGRTDAGVHARGQVAHFHDERSLDVATILHSLNGILPYAIRIKTLELAESHFHAQHSAKRKEYHYYLHLESVMDPFKQLYCWQPRKHINLEILKKACTLFLGTHDFTSFANEAHAGAASKDPVRRLYRLDVIEEAGGCRLEFEGDGFLYKMVRNIVGTLIDISSGKRNIEEIPLIFEAKDRRKASQAAPAKGLFLMRVDY